MTELNPDIAPDPTSVAEQKAEHLVNQLGGPTQARLAAVKYKTGSQSQARRAFWTAVIAVLDGED